MLSIAVHTDTNHCNLDARPLAQNAPLDGQEEEVASRENV